ncbi:MAG: DUF4868 domain-containing protein [Oceanicaulis sp.]|nr:DUF4868 domain-containing protein [Oceanicaulis sp.]
MNLLALCRDANGITIKRIPLNGALQNPVTQIFSDQEAAFRANRPNEVAFDGDWNPDDDEILVLDATAEANEMVAAASGNVLAIQAIDAANFDEENIKALFVPVNRGGAMRLLVQRFTVAQILSRKFAVIANNNQFNQITDPAFNLATSLTCIIEGGQIKFDSYHKLRAVFDVLEFFAAATDDDIDDFASHASIAIANVPALKELVTQTERKLIHKLASSGVLNAYTPQQIQGRARAAGLAVNLTKGQIAFPDDKQEIRRLLRFLDDSLYEAALSGQRYETNSKRRV